MGGGGGCWAAIDLGPQSMATHENDEKGTNCQCGPYSTDHSPTYRNGIDLLTNIILLSKPSDFQDHLIKINVMMKILSYRAQIF